jgi:transposase
LIVAPHWTIAPVVAAYQAMRGVAFSTATTLVAEACDLRRFDHPLKLMAFLGLMPPSARRLQTSFQCS